MNQDGLFEKKISYQLYSQKDGQELVILVHPLGMHRAVWEKTIMALCDDYAVLVLDLPGHGSSSAVNVGEDWSINALAKMIQDLTFSLGYQHAHYVGTSIGGAIGQELLLSSPDFLQSLVVTNTSHQIGTQESWQVRADSIRLQGLRKMAANIVPRWFSTKYYKENPSNVALWQQQLEACDNEGYAVLCEALGHWNATDRLPERSLAIPVLAVAGSQDPAMPLTNMQELAGLMSAPLEVMAVGHVPSVEAPERFNQLLIKWLDEI